MAQKHTAQIILFPLLLPLSYIFGLLARLRLLLYRLRIKKSHKAKIPCICVGNISWGGTGKSPVIDYLLKYLHGHGISSAVLTRGYGAKLPGLPLVLDKNSKSDTLNLPDEPCMLLQKNPFATIIIDPKRAEGAQFTEKNLPHIQSLLMDDGFQHFGLERDFNFVLLDKDDLSPFSLQTFRTNNWNTLIPAGSWREPKSALSRADAFLLKCPKNEWEKLQNNAAAKLVPFGKPLFVFEIVPEKLVPIFRSEAKPITRYTLLAGIGNPEQFRRSTENFLGMPCSGRIYLPDHADMQKALPRILSADMPVVCTEKDAVKLKNIPELSGRELYYTQTSVRFHSCAFSSQEFNSWLDTNILTKFNR